jgi:hypothetical protein
VLPFFSAGVSMMMYFHGGGGWFDNKFTGKKPET